MALDEQAAGPCPERARIGSAVAQTPLLAQPLTGPVVAAALPGQALPGVRMDLFGAANLSLIGTVEVAPALRTTFAGIPDLRLLNGGSSLNDYIRRDKFDTAQFAPNTMRGVEVKGKTLALPHAYAGNELALVANRGLFQKAGVPLPAADWKNSWTWPQFREALKRLTNFAGSRLGPGLVALGVIGLWLVGVAATLMPARRAARLSPALATRTV